MTLFREIIGKSRKEFVHQFEFSIKRDPEDNHFQVTNVDLYSEKKQKNLYLVYGSYDLLYCYREDNKDYEVKRITKPFHAIIPVKLMRPVSEKDKIERQVFLDVKGVQITSKNLISGNIGKILNESIGVPKKVTVEVIGSVMLQIELLFKEELMEVKPYNDNKNLILPQDKVYEKAAAVQEKNSGKEQPLNKKQAKADRQKQVKKEKHVEKESLSVAKKGDMQTRYAQEYRKLAKYGWFEKQYLANISPYNKAQRKGSKNH